jgi:acyl-CoA thioesterase-1
MFTIHKFVLTAAAWCLLAGISAADEKKLNNPDFGERKGVKPKVVDVPGLPRVLLIGDSITTGYSGRVRELLAGKANVHRCKQNGGSSSNGMTSLESWLGDGKWDIIHFNFGLHDLKYLDDKGAPATPKLGRHALTLEHYEHNLRELTRRLRKTGAKLIFATTTPIPTGAAGRAENDELAYNRAAEKIMRELSVPINDLHAVVVPVQAKIQMRRNVHFTVTGYELLGDAVAAKIILLLSH